MKRKPFCTDALFVCLLAVFWILLLLGGILRLWVLLLLSIPFGAVAALRFFLGGEQRKRENEIFLRIVRAPLLLFERRKYVFSPCPACEARLRFPKKKVGKYRVRCPRCGYGFSLTLDGKTAKADTPEERNEQ